MTVKDLKYGDIVELWWDNDFRMVLSDEFDTDATNDIFLANEDSEWEDFKSISKVWRENENGDYILIYKKEQ